MHFPPLIGMASSRRIALPLAGFAREALDTEAARSGLSHARLVALAAEHHLAEHGWRRLAGELPRFLVPSADQVEVELTLDREVWNALELDAAAAAVPLERLLAHATLRFVADLDADRVSVRELDRR